MNMKVFLLLLMLISGLVLSAKDVVTGFVYEDSNGNHKREKNEKPLPGVPVSNGKEVVLTDQNGKYQLQVGTDNIIFVVKPSGYKMPGDENNLPQFYYIHKPQGSPKMEYSGVLPTGDLPHSVDFALYLEKKEEETFRVLLFGDPQVHNLDELYFFEKRIISELTEVKDIAFGISLGDLVGNNPDLFIPYAKEIKKIGVPWFNVIGNHDLNQDAKNDSLSDESFESVFGPSTYSFNQGKVHFIILKNIIDPDPRDQKSYWGGFSKNQLDFIKNDLSFVPKDHLIVLAFHIPIWEGHVQLDIFRDQDRDALFSLLKDYPHTLSISAHTHIQFNKFLTKQDGWLQDKPHHHFNAGATCASWYRGQLDANGIPLSVMSDGTPQGYSFIEFNNNQYKIDFRIAGQPEDHQMNVYHPKVMGRTKKSLSNLYVNFFMGAESDKVMFRVDQGKWTPMNYTIAYDPSYLDLLHQWDFTEEVIPGRRPVDPKDCYHLWKATLPSNLEIGQHSIEVKATDMFGKAHYSKSSYNIAQPKGKDL